MKYKYRNRSFWRRAYYVDSVGKNEIAIRKYIDNQLKEDRLSEQLTPDKIDPFMGSKNKLCKRQIVTRAFKRSQNIEPYRR